MSSLDARYISDDFKAKHRAMYNTIYECVTHWHGTRATKLVNFGDYSASKGKRGWCAVVTNSDREHRAANFDLPKSFTGLQFFGWLQKVDVHLSHFGAGRVLNF